jgi:hypothetical protein
MVFGYAKTTLKLNYKSDGKPVKGEVLINGKNVQGAETYILEEPFYWVVYNVKATVDVAGFNEVIAEYSDVHIGNTLTYAACIIGSAYAIVDSEEKLDSEDHGVKRFQKNYLLKNKA